MRVKPCKCGSAVKVRIQHPLLRTGKRDTLYRVQCPKCDNSTKHWWYPRKAAIAVWNNGQDWDFVGL